MSVLSELMRASVALSAGTQLLPGRRVSFKDREAPKPLEERLKGSVLGLSLYFNGEALELDGVVVRFDDDGTGAFSDEQPEIFQKDELDQLEALVEMHLTHELCSACGCPSWDAFPVGVLAHWWICQRCGHFQGPHKEDARGQVHA